MTQLRFLKDLPETQSLMITRNSGSRSSGGHTYPYPPGSGNVRKRCVEAAATARDGGNGRILTLRRASGEASLMNDGLLGPRLVLGHGAPMLKRGLAAGAVAFRLFCHNDEKVSFSNDPPRRGGRGPDLSETNEKKKKSYPRRATKNDEGPLRH